jgi:hypothetical protein
MVVSTGQFTFDRFVRDQGFCMTDEITDPAWVGMRPRGAALPID